MADSPDSVDQNRSERTALYGVVEGFYGRPWTPSQRRELFKRMKSLGLNTYMYAPKDDFKHRAYWRELYSVEEAEQLTNLITAAKEHNITFYYALSPGLDISFSNPKEVTCLKRKLEQVQQFGCEAFALLFDDIEPEISETDKEVFQSFGHAQVSVTNEVYQALDQPHFLFCPTEYCSTRAVPNIQSSDYLNIIGSKLLPEIDVMWTGPKVISKIISVQSMQELTEVLRRKPVIWDNIHANDYDAKRIFLGPYDGRSTEVIPYIRGVLTNPNCEFESNFIPIHTIAQWSKCVKDAKCDSLSSNSSDARLETETEDGSDEIPVDLNPKIYHPRRALQLAIRAWFPEFNRVKLVYAKPTNVHLAPPTSQKGSLTDVNNVEQSVINELPSVIEAAIDTIESIKPIEPTEVAREKLEPGEDSLIQPISKELTNSLIPQAVILQPVEPMECVPFEAVKTGEENVEKLESLLNEPPQSPEKPFEFEQMQIEPETKDENSLTYEDISLLVDLFYLPFEHGPKGLQLLNEFNWLRSHSDILTKEKKSDKKANGFFSEQSPDLQEWHERARKFEQSANAVNRLLSKLTFCKNRCLVHELYPYVWDIRGLVCLLNAYVKWLSLGTVPNQAACFIAANYTWFSKGYREAFSNGEQEPWIFRGGLCGDLQRLLPIENINDLFLYKAPDNPTSHVYTIRPFVPSDEARVYEICMKTCTVCDPNECKEYPDLIGDLLVGHYLTLSSEFCFVVENEFGICGYLLGAPDARQFQKKVDLAWIPDLCSKYSTFVETLSKKTLTMNSVEKLFDNFKNQSNQQNLIPSCVYSSHPSICRFSVLEDVVDTSVPKRMMSCLMAALKANGSKGVFSVVDTVKESHTLETFGKLGFQEIHCPDELPSTDNQLYFGRMF